MFKPFVRGFRRRAPLGASLAIAVLAVSLPASAQSECDPNAVLSVLAYKEQGNLDPAKTVGPVSDGTRFWLYDSLIRVAPDGSLVPGLATAWSFETPTRFKLTLREGVVFHDGTPFNAEAVKATFDRNRAHPAVSASWTQPMAPVAGVSVAGEYEVIYELKEPKPAFAFALTAAPGMVISPAALDKPLDLDAVGTGPFKLAKFTPGVGADLVRNDQYWDKQALACSPKEVHLLDIPDTQAVLNAAIAGQLQIGRADPNQVAQAEGAGLVIKSMTTASVHSFWFDFKNPALRNPLVRKAMMYAVDREALAKGLGLGLADADAQIFPPGFYAYNPAPEVQPAAFAYDPEKAKAMLSEAGYPEGITFKVLLYAFPFDQALFQAIQAQMSAAGINLEPQIMSNYQAFLQRQADMFFGTGSGRPDPFDFLTAQVASNGVYNPDKFPPSDALSAVVAEIAATDPLDAKRKDLLQKASRLVTEEVKVMPILTLKFNWALNKCVTNFNPPSFGALQPAGLGWKAGCS